MVTRHILYLTCETDEYTLCVMNSTALENDRDATIRTIRTNLRKRGLKWVTVRGGRGTAWGWITICAAPSKGANRYGNMTEEQRAELATALGLDTVHHQGVSVPAGSDYRAEYIARSEGKTPSVVGVPYWD